MFTEKLHLHTSMRSFRSERLSDFIGALLDLEVDRSKEIYSSLKDNYPLYVTRDLEMAKRFLKESSRGNERYGIVASSDARRLKARGLDVKCKIGVEHWFLGTKDDVRSSFYMEDLATEFDIQGLELDWVCMAWGGDFRYTNGCWTYKSFRGTRWQNINGKGQRLYKKNSYRVLLTRARQGMIIYIPKGNDEDQTRKPEYYDGTYDYLRGIGIDELESKYFTNLITNDGKIKIPTNPKVKPKTGNTQNRLEDQTIKNRNNYRDSGIKIGELVRTSIRELSASNLIDNKMVKNLMESQYSKRIFNLSYPFMIKIDRQKDLRKQRMINNHTRYWAEIFIINGDDYFICSEWFEDRHRSFFEGWKSQIIP